MGFGIPEIRSIFVKFVASGTVVMAERELWVSFQIGFLFDVQRVSNGWGRLITGGVADILPSPPIM